MKGEEKQQQEGGGGEEGEKEGAAINATEEEKAKGRVSVPKRPVFSLSLQRFHRLKDLSNILYSSGPLAPFAWDGLTFVNIVEQYKLGYSSVIMQWKPHFSNSVDLQLRPILSSPSSRPSSEISLDVSPSSSSSSSSAAASKEVGASASLPNGSDVIPASETPSSSPSSSAEQQQGEGEGGEKDKTIEPPTRTPTPIPVAGFVPSDASSSPSMILYGPGGSFSIPTSSPIPQMAPAITIDEIVNNENGGKEKVLYQLQVSTRDADAFFDWIELDDAFLSGLIGGDVDLSCLSTADKFKALNSLPDRLLLQCVWDPSIITKVPLFDFRHAPAHAYPSAHSSSPSPILLSAFYNRQGGWKVLKRVVDRVQPVIDWACLQTVSSINDQISMSDLIDVFNRW